MAQFLYNTIDNIAPLTWSRIIFSYEPLWVDEESKSFRELINKITSLYKAQQESSTISENLNDFLKTYSKFVNIDDMDAVYDYIMDMPDKVDAIIDILIKIYSLASKYFSNESHFSLEINHDPEIKDEYLKFVIRQDPYSQDIMEKIDQIQNECANDIIDKDIWILVTTDFQPPR